MSPRAKFSRVFRCDVNTCRHQRCFQKCWGRKDTWFLPKSRDMELGWPNLPSWKSRGFWIRPYGPQSPPKKDMCVFGTGPAISLESVGRNEADDPGWIPILTDAGLWVPVLRLYPSCRDVTCGISLWSSSRARLWPAPPVWNEIKLFQTQQYQLKYGLGRCKADVWGRGTRSICVRDRKPLLWSQRSCLVAKQTPFWKVRVLSKELKRKSGAGYLVAYHYSQRGFGAHSLLLLAPTNVCRYSLWWWQLKEAVVRLYPVLTTGVRAVSQHDFFPGIWTAYTNYWCKY